ncbi:hypothetical protein ABIA38_008118 [Embleya sp. AB8]
MPPTIRPVHSPRHRRTPASGRIDRPTPADLAALTGHD